MKKNDYALGVMLDVSRNAVMTMEHMKKFLLKISEMGYNCMFLYAENTYEVEGEPYFGYMRGRYSQEEMREMDEYAKSLGIKGFQGETAIYFVRSQNSALLTSASIFDIKFIS